MVLIKKGLDIPIAGIPKPHIDNDKKASVFAILGTDYHGLKPKVLVSIGDDVKVGTSLLIDKENPSVPIVSPASGKVIEINRGYRRVLKSVVIQSDYKFEGVKLDQYKGSSIDLYTKEQLINLIVESGLWTSFKTRPFSLIPNPKESSPSSIFVTAIDSNPLSINPKLIIDNHVEDFQKGLELISQLSPKVYLCSKPDLIVKQLPEGVSQHHFDGVHPSGLVGTHIHHLDAVGTDEKTVWNINYQDVIAIGKLLSSCIVSFDRYTTLAGPNVINPRVIKTIVGASIIELTTNEISSSENKTTRLISGSILNGHTAVGSLSYLGRYHLQITALDEGEERPMFHYIVAGRNRFSKLPIYLSKLAKNRLWNFTTTTNGSDRAMVPIGIYDEVMPLDILPVQLLRALIVSDYEVAIQLGCLELDEEDLALCTYVCPGKYDYGTILRNNLMEIKKIYS